MIPKKLMRQFLLKEHASFLLLIVLLGSAPWSQAMEPVVIAPGTGTVIQETIHEDEAGNKERWMRTGKIKNREGAPRVGQIYDEDKERIRNRILALDLWSFSFGPGKATGLANENSFYTFTFGRHWEVTENAEIRSLGNIFLPSKGSGYMLGYSLGGSYFFSTTDISPVLGADLGIAAAQSDNGSSTQFSGGFHGGLRFFRTSNTQMQLIAFTHTIFDNKNPSVIGLQLGVLFQ